MPYNPNSARTQFKKGNLPHNTKHLGHERVSKDGYIEISVDEVNPHTGFGRRYVLKHRHLWEQENGPVPEGHVLKCLDGNRLNTAPSNWEAIPRAIIPHLQARYGMDYDQAEPEVKPAIMTIAKLKHAARTATNPRGRLGREIGEENLRRVRAFFSDCLCATNRECAAALNLSEFAVARHVRTIRAEWDGA